MKMVWLIMILALLPMVSAQGVPQDIDNPTIQAIAQEHKNTRKFFSDELTRQRNEFFNTMETQATAYERKANNMISDATWKLGLMWGGVVLFVFGISNFLGRRLEKRKWNKMLESAKEEIIADVNQQKAQIDQQHNAKSQELNNKEQELMQKQQQLEKARPQLVQMQKKIQQQQQELANIMQSMNMR